MLKGYDDNHLGGVSPFTVTVGNLFDNNDQGKLFQIQESVKTMNSNEHWKLITSYLIRNRTQGFTLLELAIVFLVVSAMTIIALPMYVSQAGKARVTEAKQTLGVINRMQQTYRFEQGVFATTLGDLNLQLTVGSYTGGDYQTQYFQYSIEGVVNNDEVHHLATPRPLYVDDTHKITSAIIWQGVSAQSLVCEGNDSNVTPVIVSATECQNGKFTY